MVTDCPLAIRSWRMDLNMDFEAPFVRLRKRYCAETIAREVAALGPGAWVPHPAKLPGNDALLLITAQGQITNAFTGPMAPTEHLKKCPYIMNIMTDLGGVWGRSRLMGLAPGAQVPDHVDINYYWRTHIRIHIPVITSPKVLFTCDRTTVHMQAGECWVFDSFRKHNVQNGGTAKRIHLVLDTVGTPELWDLIETAKTDDLQSPAGGPFLAPRQSDARALAFEQYNVPSVMTPWEVRCHIGYVLSHVKRTPAVERIAARLDRFAYGWLAVWTQFGPSPEGQAAYRRLVEGMQAELHALGASAILLANEVPIDRVLSELIFRAALPAAQPPQARVVPSTAKSLQTA
tara:strand:- start:6614 stop:7651 length:1038 start_codon:yes stop_codon:yes gene_type:complete